MIVSNTDLSPEIYLMLNYVTNLSAEYHHKLVKIHGQGVYVIVIETVV